MIHGLWNPYVVTYTVCTYDGITLNISSFPFITEIYSLIFIHSFCNFSSYITVSSQVVWMCIKNVLTLYHMYDKM